MFILWPVIIYAQTKNENELNTHCILNFEEFDSFVIVDWLSSGTSLRIKLFSGGTKETYLLSFWLLL